MFCKPIYCRNMANSNYLLFKLASSKMLGFLRKHGIALNDMFVP